MKDFEIVFNVPMECNACVDSVSKALKPIQEVSDFHIDLDSNIVTTKSSLPPSELVKIIQSTGKDAIIRGTGKPNSAAVCMLESFDAKDIQQPVKGLARIVNVNTDELFIDLTVNGLPKGTYYPLIRKSGNLSKGALSTGDSMYTLSPIEIMTKATTSTTINSLGAASYTEQENMYSGQAFLHAKMNVMDLIGRSLVLSKSDKPESDSLVGIIARSAGAWENDKQICSCSGKTVWEERREAIGKGLRG